jgi:hypothetical protein
LVSGPEDVATNKERLFVTPASWCAGRKTFPRTRLLLEESADGSLAEKAAKGL